MKCISLWQPWAQLIAIGAKRMETRSWCTDYRGPLLIHAAKKWDAELAKIFASDPFFPALDKAGYWHAAMLPKGAIVARCELVNCVDIREPVYVFDSYAGRPHKQFVVPPLMPERAFGDYTPGRFAWLLDKIECFIRPIPFRGAQGFFDVPDTAITRTRRPFSAPAASTAPRGLFDELQTGGASWPNS